MHFSTNLAWLRNTKNVALKNLRRFINPQMHNGVILEINKTMLTLFAN